ncbi:transcription termination factor NusA [Litorilinea aerophila]|uniref:Transcription termination/antitermination protein NusA n=1 Tax=Litorilinea aerophila TaxID=1204385 RepID=A0A540VBM3_9CHLR|nr:transcription termination factor NusA [Litorilinea aerophila]MCC9078063.1 transcription termination factor NusA [Litorilinea aerophila]GIV76016.1 MAG: hypothetical protein KatS3mg050_0410 [Litorilinea sp.]
MSKALIAGINQVASDKGLDREVIFEAIEAALISAYKRNYGSIANVTSEVDRLTGEMRVYAEREVVEEVLNPRTEITLEEARRIKPDAQLGDIIRVPTQPADFGRIAAQAAKQVILQRIREAERDTVFENFAHRVGEVINAQVRSTDNASGAVTVMLDEKHESILLREEQIPGERLRRGDYVKVYIVDVHKSTRGPVIKLSRTHRNLLRRLMEQEIPEVRDGVVEIKAIAREPGARSKAAVIATVPGVDPVGSCVGMRGLRIQNIVNELAGEKIDVVEWSPDTATYIANALSPAKVNSVLLDDSGPIKTAIVVVPDRQLSLAIGKEGQNARLAAKLTGWRIDIKSESEAMEEGLDRLIAEQAKNRRSDDLLSMAERFLQQSEQAPSTEDLFSKAAKALEEMEARRAEAEEEGSLLPPVEMPDLPLEAPKSFDDFWPVEEESPETPALEQETPAVEWPELPPEEPPIGELAGPLAEADEEDDGLPPEGLPADVTRVDELPEVITADMLRARKNVDFNFEEIEIPPELLAGIDEDDDLWDDEELPKGKKKSKPRAKAKKGGKPDAGKPKGKKRPRPLVEDDEYDEYL